MSLIADIHRDLEKGALQLLVEYRDRLLSEALKLCGDAARAEDLVFLTIERVLAKSDSYRTDENLFGWMKTILENLYLNEEKRPDNRRVKIVDPNELEGLSGLDFSAEERILRNSDGEAVRAALGKLDPKDREILVMRFYEDLTLEQIAACLNCPTTSVWRRIQVAIKLLSGKLNAEVKAKKPLAILAAFLLAGSLFGAAAWGIVEVANAIGSLGSEVALESEETLGSLESEGSLGSAADPKDPNPDPIVSKDPNPDPVVPKDSIPAEQISTTENTEEEETMNLKSITQKAAKLAVGAALTTGFAANASAEGWIYDSSAKTLTENVTTGTPWVLTVTVANSTELSVTKVTTDGTNMELDFSGSIKDANGTDYTIVSLDGFSGKPITKLVFPTGIRTTKRDAFLNCTSLVTVEPLIPDTITELGQRCFAGCTALEGEVVFPAHEVKSTYSWTNGTWGWFNGSKITTADLSAATMTEIVKESFANCANLKWVKLPKGVTTIGSDAFTGSAALETIEPFLPATVTSFGSCPFRNCSSLTGDVKLTNRNAIILFTHHGNNSFGVFQGCSKIASFEMTAGITHNQDGEGYIDNNMFNGCAALGSVTLPANVKGLTRSGIFSGCTSLTNVTFLGWQAPTSFGKNAFDGVTDNLPRIFYPRLSPTWEAFVPTLTGFEPMSEALAATYLGKYPDATVLPLGRFKLYQRWVWVSDLEDEDSNSYYVLGDPVEATDEGSPVTPAYGGYHGFANGETVEFAAPQIGGYNSGEYRCKGYALSYETALRTWSAPVTNAGTTCSITQADDKVWRLVWLWGPNGYELNSTPINEGGTVTCDPPNTGLYEPGTAVTLTATADTANGYRFLCWTGDHAPTGDAAFDPVATVQMDDSRVIRAAFASSTWTYDGNKTMTDGNWVLTVKKTGTELSVESVVSAYTENSIDFTRKIVDGNGEEYSVVWINGFQGKGLVEVVLPAGLRGLGKNAFYRCSKLRTVTPLLPASLTELGQCAFSQTAVEGDVVLPANTITSTYSWSNDAYGWFNGTQITSFDGSAATMTEIVDGSFSGCSKLKWVKLPQGVTTIGDNAFYEATALEAIEPFFPDTVTSVGRGVLYGNSIFSQPLILRGKADIVTTRNLNLSWDGVISGTKIPSADLSGGIVNLSNGCFGNASSLGSIVLGPKLDTLEGSSLSAAGLTNVVFLGDAPSSIDNKTTFRDRSSYQIVVTLPLAKPGWQAYAANHFRDPTVEEKTSYRAKYPNGRKLSKIWTQVNQGTTLIYVCDSKNTGMKLIFK